MEEVLLSCPSYPRRGNLRGLRSQSVAHSRDGVSIGTPKKDAEEWTSEWFYIETPLLDPTRRGMPAFSLAPPKKWFNW